MIKMHEANQQVMGKLLGTIRQRQRGGLATGLDVARLEAQLAAERQLRASARYEFEHAKLGLVNLLALPMETPLTLADEWSTEVPDLPVPQPSVEEALSQWPEVQAQYTRVKVAELTYASITGERLHSLVAQGDTGWSGTDGITRWIRTVWLSRSKSPSSTVRSVRGASHRRKVGGSKRHFG